MARCHTLSAARWTFGGQQVPQYTATTVLSPEQQQLLDQQTQADYKTNQ